MCSGWGSGMSESFETKIKYAFFFFLQPVMDSSWKRMLFPKYEVLNSSHVHAKKETQKTIFEAWRVRKEGHVREKATVQHK